MNYVVGQVVLGGTYKISNISESSDGSVAIWVYSDENRETLMWKRFNKNTPISFEYNIEF
jgi:hypothetical protein